MKQIRSKAMRAVALVLVLSMAIAYSPVPRKASAEEVTLKVTNSDKFKDMAPGKSVKLAYSLTKGKITSVKSSDETTAKPFSLSSKKGTTYYIKAVSPGKATVTVSAKYTIEKKVKKKKKKKGYTIKKIKKTIKTTIDVSVKEEELTSLSFKSSEFYFVFVDDKQEDPDIPDPDDPDADESDDPDSETYDDDDNQDSDDDDDYLQWSEVDDNQNEYKLISKPFTVPEEKITDYFTFTSSDPTVGDIDDDGNVHILKEGSFTITATYIKNPNLTASMHVTAGPLPDSVIPDDPDDSDETEE